MNKSETITKLAEALSKAQAEMPVIRMNAQNPFLKNKYADLGAVIETSRPVLAKHGLSVAQFPTSEGDRIGIDTILMHSSGEYLEQIIYIPASENKGLSVAQSAGIVISYLRRYSWASVLGLYADEDTDGHQPGTVSKPATDEIVTDKMWKSWTELVSQADVLKVPHQNFDRATVKKNELISTGKELREIVTNAQAQAKAGQ